MKRTHDSGRSSGPPVDVARLDSWPELNPIGLPREIELRLIGGDTSGAVRDLMTLRRMSRNNAEQMALRWRADRIR